MLARGPAERRGAHIVVIAIVIAGVEGEEVMLRACDGRRVRYLLVTQFYIHVFVRFLRQHFSRFPRIIASPASQRDSHRLSAACTRAIVNLYLGRCECRMFTAPK